MIFLKAEDKMRLMEAAHMKYLQFDFAGFQPRLPDLERVLFFGIEHDRNSE
jgi:hypothetical protein